jgi:predicted NodU family carbamoyl transferase
MSLILRLNASHGDSSGCQGRDGQLFAASEEARFNRIKPWSGFPVNAVHFPSKNFSGGHEQINVFISP